VGAYNEMASKEESDETKTEDQHILGKSPKPCTTSRDVVVGDVNHLLLGGCLYANHVCYM
jgi:hypothetical protein